MKILRVLNTLDEAYGGPSVSSVESILAVNCNDIETTVVVPDKTESCFEGRSGVQRLRQASIRVKWFPLSPFAGNYGSAVGLSFPLAYWLACNASKFDIVHAHSPWSLSALTATISAKRAGTPVILTPHESLTRTDMVTAKSWFTKFLKMPLSQFYFRTLDGIVFSSKLELLDSSTSNLNCHSFVLYHPLATFNGRTSKPPIKSKSPNSNLVFGFLGRLHPKKNIQLLLRAFARLPDRVRLRIAGDGPIEERNRLRSAIIKFGIEHRIDWLGFIGADEKKQFFETVDALVMPSEFECFGMAAAESIANGTPVIITSNSGVAEILRLHGTGLIIEPEEQDLYRLMRHLIDSPEVLYQQARDNFNALHKELSKEIHGKKLSEVYYFLKKPS